MLGPSLKRYNWLIILVFITASAYTQADEALYQQRCAACHGENGEGNAAMQAPSIAAMSQAYLERQLRHFRDGQRGTHTEDTAGQTMRAMALPLTDKMIATVSAYLFGLPEPVLFTEKEFAGFRGRGLYSGCASCHGAGGEGYPDLGAPKLTQQHSWYLRAQIDNFRKGLRGTHKEDERGQQMRLMAESIHSEADIDSLIKHITGLGVK